MKGIHRYLRIHKIRTNYLEKDPKYLDLQIKIDVINRSKKNTYFIDAEPVFKEYDQTNRKLIIHFGKRVYSRINRLNNLFVPNSIAIYPSSKITLEEDIPLIAYNLDPRKLSKIGVNTSMVNYLKDYDYSNFEKIEVRITFTNRNLRDLSEKDMIYVLNKERDNVINMVIDREACET